MWSNRCVEQSQTASCALLYAQTASCAHCPYVIYYSTMNPSEVLSKRGEYFSFCSWRQDAVPRTGIP